MASVGIYYGILKYHVPVLGSDVRWLVLLSQDSRPLNL